MSRTLNYRGIGQPNHTTAELYVTTLHGSTDVHGAQFAISACMPQQREQNFTDVRPDVKSLLESTQELLPSTFRLWLLFRLLRGADLPLLLPFT
jgi:hypothetical protein